MGSRRRQGRVASLGVMALKPDVTQEALGGEESGSCQTEASRRNEDPLKNAAPGIQRISIPENG